MLTRTTGRKAIIASAASLLAAVALTAPANAATMIESSPGAAGETSFNFTNYSWGAAGSVHPGDTALTFSRKAGG